MAYTHRLYPSIGSVDAAEWDEVCRQGHATIFMDRRFIAAVEAGMRDQCRFWHLIIHDDAGQAVACATLSTIKVDIANLADPRTARLVRRLPAFTTRLRTLLFLFCGSPLSSGENAFAWTGRCDMTRALPLLDSVLSKIASQEGVNFIVFKEFTPAESDALAALTAIGYNRLESPPYYRFAAPFASFDEYRSAVRNHYRTDINNTRKKLNQDGIEVEVLTDAQEMDDAYTAAVHQLYLNVSDKAEMKLEVIGANFVHELVTRMPDNMSIVTIKKDGRIIGFVWCLQDEHAFYPCYCGIDYTQNTEYELYFNLQYEVMAYALQQHVSMIEFAQTGDDFKAKLGCDAEPRYAFARGVGWFMSPMFRNVLARLFAPAKQAPHYHVYRDQVEAAPAERPVA